MRPCRSNVIARDVRHGDEFTLVRHADAKKKKRIRPAWDSYRFCCFMFYIKQIKLRPSAHHGGISVE